jgi:hypothetical protein
MEEQFTRLKQESAIKKVIPSRGGLERHHQAEVKYVQSKGIILIGFLSYRSVGVSWETSF